MKLAEHRPHEFDKRLPEAPWNIVPRRRGETSHDILSQDTQDLCEGGAGRLCQGFSNDLNSRSKQVTPRSLPILVRKEGSSSNITLS